GVKQHISCVIRGRRVSPEETIQRIRQGRERPVIPAPRPERRRRPNVGREQLVNALERREVRISNREKLVVPNRRGPERPRERREDEQRERPRPHKTTKRTALRRCVSFFLIE